MMRTIGLLSDTHGYLDEAVFHHFAMVDEIWHAGDFGTLELVRALEAFKPLRGVWGNIDGPEIRHQFPETLVFDCEGVRVAMIHIGGYPGKYTPQGRSLLREARPQLFISGHSHILKVMYDASLSCLHMNPGAAGRQGWHKIPTLLRFRIDGTSIEGCEVIELGGKRPGGGE